MTTVRSELDRHVRGMGYIRVTKLNSTVLLGLLILVK
jgi:hypothetical protein